LPVTGLLSPSPAQSFGGTEHAQEFYVSQFFVGHMSYPSLNSEKYSISVKQYKTADEGRKEWLLPPPTHVIDSFWQRNMI
jgi:hypothetical protein